MKDRITGADLEPWADFRAAGLVVPGKVIDVGRKDATMPDGDVVTIDVSPIHIDGDKETVLVPTDAAHVNKISPPHERRIQ